MTEAAWPQTFSGTPQATTSLSRPVRSCSDTQPQVTRLRILISLEASPRLMSAPTPGRTGTPYLGPDAPRGAGAV